MNFLHFVLTSFLVASFSFPSLANKLGQHHPYYTKIFYEKVESGAKDRTIQNLLFQVLSQPHKVDDNGNETLVRRCESKEQNCYQHTPMTYNQARAFVLGYLDLQQQKNGKYFLKDVYCQETYEEKDFAEGQGPGPNMIPDHKVFSVEHTWPQSRFSKRFSDGFQKPDLHILYGVSQRANNSRGNSQFADVQIDQNPICPTVRRGWVRGNIREAFFEPPDEHKGNVARAIFYFSVRYQLPVSEIEEQSLRRWHKLDPVDEEERARHEEIFKVQKVRNPFIDHQELADLISDF